MRLVLIGGGGHASDVLSVLEALNFGYPVGIVADTPVDLRRFAHRGVEQWGTIDDLRSIDASRYVIAIGYSQPRKHVAARVHGLGLEPLTVIHPTAWVPKSVSVGPGTVIMAGAIVSELATVGAHVCLHHNSVIGHDCVVGDFSTVMPGAVVSGDTMLNGACLIGAGAVVLEGCEIGADTVVAAGAVVTRSIPAGVTALGAPARW